MVTKEKIQNVATNVFVANGWIDNPEDVVEAKGFHLFDAFSDRLSKSQGIANLRKDNYENYLFLIARDYFSLGYAAVYQQTWSKTPYYELTNNEIEKILDEIWEVGAFEYSIGPMGPAAKARTQDICLMAQTFETKFVGIEHLKEEENLTFYKKAFFNIGLAIGYKFCKGHL